MKTTTRGRCARARRAGLRALAAVSFAVLAAVVPAGCKDKEAERVDQTLVTLSDANANRDADTVYSLLTQRTVDYYNDIINLARKAKKEELLRQGPTVVFEVVNMRLNYSEKQLRTLTAESYIREAVKAGTWQFLFDDEDLKLGTPVVAGDSARVPLQERAPEQTARGFGRRARRASLVSNLMNRPERPVFQIYLVRDDDNVWRLDETSMVDMQDRLIEDVMSKVGKSLEGFVNEVLSDENENPPPVAVWSPPKAGAPALRPSR